MRFFGGATWWDSASRWVATNTADINKFKTGATVQITGNTPTGTVVRLEKKRQKYRR